MKKILVLILGMLALVGCAKDADPISVSQSNNNDIQVELLFNHDGCKMYRFTDNDRYHYFTKCDNATSQTIEPKTVTLCQTYGKGMICHKVDDGQELIGEGK